MTFKDKVSVEDRVVRFITDTGEIIVKHTELQTALEVLEERHLLLYLDRYHVKEYGSIYTVMDYVNTTVHTFSVHFKSRETNQILFSLGTTADHIYIEVGDTLKTFETIDDISFIPRYDSIIKSIFAAHVSFLLIIYKHNVACIVEEVEDNYFFESKLNSKQALCNFSKKATINKDQLLSALDGVTRIFEQMPAVTVTKSMSGQHKEFIYESCDITAVLDVHKFVGFGYSEKESISINVKYKNDSVLEIQQHVQSRHDSKPGYVDVTIFGYTIPTIKLPEEIMKRYEYLDFVLNLTNGLHFE